MQFNGRKVERCKLISDIPDGVIKNNYMRSIELYFTGLEAPLTLEYNSPNAVVNLNDEVNNIILAGYKCGWVRLLNGIKGQNKDYEHKRELSAMKNKYETIIASKDKELDDTKKYEQRLLNNIEDLDKYINYLRLSIKNCNNKLYHARRNDLRYSDRENKNQLDELERANKRHRDRRNKRKRSRSRDRSHARSCSIEHKQSKKIKVDCGGDTRKVIIADNLPIPEPDAQVKSEINIDEFLGEIFNAK